MVTYVISMQAGEGSRKRKREEEQHVPPPIQELEPVPPPIQEEEEPVPAPPVPAPPVPAPPVPAPAVPAPPVPAPYEELQDSDGSLEVSYTSCSVPLHVFHCVWFVSLIITCTFCCCAV